MEKIRTNYNRPYIIVEFNSETSEEAKTWLIKRIRDDELDNGCELDVEVHGNLLHISASLYRLLYGAEEVRLKKEYKDGSLREFCFSDGENFANFQDHEFLLPSECLYIMKIALDRLRAIDEPCIPGHPMLMLYPGKSIIRRMKSSNLVTECFPLHDRETLHKLRCSWYKNLQLTVTQPMNAIRQYFGDSISFYFAFLHFYTIGLVPLAALSTFHWSMNFWGDTFPQIYLDWLVSALHVIWSVALLEMWKRTSTVYAFKWGSFYVKELEEPRAAFHGPLGLNEITKKHEPVYPFWKRYLRVYLISCPIIIICIILAVLLMFYYFRWETFLREKYKTDDDLVFKLLKNLPSITYSIIVIGGNSVYRRLARFLTHQENHRLESTYQNYLVTKIVLFEFVNNFLCLFYIAFIYDDMDMLKRTLRNLFLVQMIISQAMESLLPYWQYQMRLHSVGTLSNYRKPFSSFSQLEKAEITREEHVYLELQKDTYIGTFDDYLELWLQFGYVVLFSCVYPLAAVFALINNLVEIRSDAFKMCNVYRRPFTFQTTGIGIWQTAFQALTYLAIVSNLAIIFRSYTFIEHVQKVDSSVTSFHILMMFIFLEHALLGIRWLVSFAIPAMPWEVEVEMDKLNYWSRQALKKPINRYYLSE